MNAAPCKVCDRAPDQVEVPGGSGSRWSCHCPKQHDWALDTRPEKAVTTWNRRQGARKA